MSWGAHPGHPQHQARRERKTVSKRAGTKMRCCCMRQRDDESHAWESKGQAQTEILSPTQRLGFWGHPAHARPAAADSHGPAARSPCRPTTAACRGSPAAAGGGCAIRTGLRSVGASPRDATHVGEHSRDPPTARAGGEGEVAEGWFPNLPRQRTLPSPPNPPRC